MGLTPEELEGREFTAALRGYDKDEVDAFLLDAAARMRQDRDDAVAQNGDPYAALGDEVASIMRSTVDQARQLRERAEEDAARIREQAEDAARRVHEAAELELEAALGARADAAREVDEAREAAARDAEETREAARRDAERIIADARGQARAVLERIVEDARERYGRLDEAEGQVIEHLRAVEALAQQAAAGLGSNRLGDALNALDGIAPRPSEFHESYDA